MGPAGIDIAVFGMLRDHMTDAAAQQADAVAAEAAAAGAGMPECAATSTALETRMRAQSPLPREVDCLLHCCRRRNSVKWQKVLAGCTLRRGLLSVAASVIYHHLHVAGDVRRSVSTTCWLDR